MLIIIIVTNTITSNNKTIGVQASCYVEEECNQRACVLIVSLVVRETTQSNGCEFKSCLKYVR